MRKTRRRVERKRQEDRERERKRERPATRRPIREKKKGSMAGCEPEWAAEDAKGRRKRVNRERKKKERRTEKKETDRRIDEQKRIGGSEKSDAGIAEKSTTREPFASIANI